MTQNVWVSGGKRGAKGAKTAHFRLEDSFSGFERPKKKHWLGRKKIVLRVWHKDLPKKNG